MNNVLGEYQIYLFVQVFATGIMLLYTIGTVIVLWRNPHGTKKNTRGEYVIAFLVGFVITIFF